MRCSMWLKVSSTERGGKWVDEAIVQEGLLWDVVWRWVCAEKVRRRELRVRFVLLLLLLLVLWLWVIDEEYVVVMLWLWFVLIAMVDDVAFNTLLVE